MVETQSFQRIRKGGGIIKKVNPLPRGRGIIEKVNPLPSGDYRKGEPPT